METFEYIPKGVCSSKMNFTIDGDIIRDIKIVGGCPGNSLGVRALTKDQKIDECGFKTTSCPDQISNALKEYKQKRYLN